MKVTIRRWKLKKGELLYLDIYHRGRLPAENLEILLDGGRGDAEKLRMAEILRSRRELELLSNIHNIPAEHSRRVSLVDYCKAQRGKLLEQSLKYIAKHFGAVQIGAVTTRQCEAYQDYLATTMQPSSVKVYFQAFAGALGRAVRERILAESPADGVRRIKVPEKAPSSLMPSEVEALARTRIIGEKGVGGEIKRAFLFACQTGLRWSDLRTLTWAKIRGRQIEKTQQKTEDAVYVPLNDAAWLMINPGDHLHAPNELVFPLLHGAQTLTTWVRPWGEAAGIQGLHFHQSRHTFIRALLDSGSDLATAQGLAGHRDIKTTAKYGRASDKQKRAAVDRL